MLGAQGGNAFVDILFGDYSPSGHLPYVWAPESSYPNVTKQNVSDGNKTDPYIYREYTYNENLYVGQRYVDKYNKPYYYPFGFGLSYSTFDFSGLSLQMKEDGLIVIFKVKNIGEYNASVVPMVFLGFPLENYPDKVFKGFDKKFLAINEEYTFKIIVEPHDLSYYDVSKESFVRPSIGAYKVYVGENARDIILKDEVNAYPKADDWSIEYEKAKQLISSYTLEEKMLLLYSTENMIGKCVGSIDANVEKNFPGICLQDGPAGVRFSKSAQSWQAAINTASTFNRTLMYEIGEAQGKEFHDKGINIMLSPCVNILRNPLGGRVWEAFGEDPFLSGEAAVQLIKGIQSQNVLACIKHFIGNEIEDPRHNSSSNIPEEALWEIYLEPFYKAVKKADVASVMESYNAVNDTFMTRNKRLLQNILKDKIGFKGFIMSDWWSINSDHYEHFANGCDMNMPGGPGWTPNKTGINGSDWYKIKDWISAGYFTEDRVNDAATRIVASMYRFNQMPTIVTSENSYPNNVNLDYNTLNDKTRALNRQAGRESIVLLKNKDNFLPLEKNQIYTHTGTTMAIIGNNAAYSDCVAGDLDVTCGDPGNQQMRFFRGYTALGWGSGTTYFNEQVPPLDAIAGSASSLGWSVTNSTKSTGDYLNEDGTYSRNEILDDINFDPTVCNSSYVTLVFIGADSGEEYLNVENNVGDRNNLDPWHNGTQVVDRALEVCSNSKIVLIVLGPATVI